MVTSTVVVFVDQSKPSRKKQKEENGTNQPIAPSAKVPIDTRIRTRELVRVSFRQVIDVTEYKYTRMI